MALTHTCESVRSLALGEIIAERYRVLGFLGSGGMGEVYEVEHLMLGRHFALKLLRPEFARDMETVRRFSREARAMAAVESEHVVGIVDFGNLANQEPYYVMERLHGWDLREHLAERGPLPVSEAVNVIIDACQGLRVVHEAGLVHRDLKPANLFMTRCANGRYSCKLLDFGVVKSLQADSTQQGSFVGTIRYMAPEQILENGVIGPWTDVYALGAVLYECLTTHTPFTGDAVERILFKIVNDDPTPIEDARSDLPAALCDVVRHALARDPTQRLQCVDALEQVLLPYSEQHERMHTVTAFGDATISASVSVPRPSQGLQRRASMLTLALLATGSGLAWYYTRSGNERVLSVAAPRQSEQDPSNGAMAKRAAIDEDAAVGRTSGLAPEADKSHAPPEQAAPSASLMPSSTLGERSARKPRKPMERMERPRVNVEPVSYALPEVDKNNPYAR